MNAFGSGRRVRPASAPVTRRTSLIDASSLTQRPSSTPGTTSRQLLPSEALWHSAGSVIPAVSSGASSPSAVAPARSQPRTPTAVDVLANSLAGSTAMQTMLDATSPEVTVNPEDSANLWQSIGKPERSLNAASSRTHLNLCSIHYASMRRQAADRADRQRDRENELDRDMEAHLAEHRRSKSYSASRRPQSAPLQTSQRPNVEGYGACSASWNAWAASVGIGASKGSPVQARRPFTAISGYGGHVPRKVANSIMGCSHYRGNMRARAAFLQDHPPVTQF